MANKILTNKDTVLSNLDLFDIRHYDEILMKSKLFQDMEKEGSKVLPSYNSLQRDIWAGLYKFNTAVKPSVGKDRIIHKAVMQNIINNPEYQSLRVYTKLDELAAALGCINLSSQVQNIVQDVVKKQEQLEKEVEAKKKEAKEKQKQAKKLMEQLKELQQQQQEQQQQQQKQNQSQEQSPGQQNQNNQQQDLQQQIQQLEQPHQQAQNLANEAKSQAEAAEQNIQTQIEKTLNSKNFANKITRAIQNAQGQTTEEMQQVSILMGGDRAGNGFGNDAGTVLDNLSIVEQLRYNSALKKTMELAGKMKNVATKKFKEKVTNTINRTAVERGTAPERLLPTEIYQYLNPATKKAFQKRYAEGETLQYSTKAKEKAGRGPVVACIDISGSMMDSIDGLNSRAEWAKAVAFALYTIAKKEKRPFYCIEFTSQVESSYKVQNDNVLDLLIAKSDGGTSFDAPLQEAFRVIKSEKIFKKADIIFITDGCSDVHFLEEILEDKKKTKTSIFSIQLSKMDVTALEKFSDQVIQYEPESQDFAKIFEI